jgi:hypothetical protein
LLRKKSLSRFPQILLFRSFFLPQISQILLIYTIRIYLVPTNLINFCSLRFALTSVNWLDYTQHSV